MSISPRERFTTELGRLRDHYPALFVEDGGEWARRVTAYWSKVRRFDFDIIKAACEAAVERHPSRFPTAGQLVCLCDSVEKDLLDAAAEERKKRLEREENRRNAEYTDLRRRKVIPDTPEAQRRWIAEAPNRFERLARECECESKNRGLDPNAPTPKDIGRGRMVNLLTVLEESNGFQMPAPAAGYDSTKSKPEPGWDG